MTVDEDAAEFKAEVLAFEAAADLALNAAKAKLAFDLFAWAHSAENPARCTRKHGDFSGLGKRP